MFGGSLAVSNSNFEGNSVLNAENGNGGAIFAFQITVNIVNTKFTGNSAASGSGAMVVGSGSTVVLEEVGGRAAAANWWGVGLTPHQGTPTAACNERGVGPGWGPYHGQRLTCLPCPCVLGIRRCGLDGCYCGAGVTSSLGLQLDHMHRVRLLDGCRWTSSTTKQATGVVRTSRTVQLT